MSGDEEERRDEAEGEPEAAPAEDVPLGDVPLCDLCGYPMREIHCKLVCDHCGYTRDCSDP
ncbi:MAG TPA: hypothetical protein VFQ22_10295 [Longimicrobiales bacterium]|nr:hypothetical protein [Longimicrobiales bacterium]